MSRKTLLTLLKLAFATALIWYVIDQAGWDDIRHSLANMDLGQWALGLLLVLAANVIAILRWHVLMASVKLNSTPWLALRLGFIGVFFNNVVPGLTGGDLVKAFYVTRENPSQRAGAVVSVIVDRVIGIVALALIAAVVIPLDFDKYGEAALGIYGFLAASAIGLGVVFSRRAKARLRGLRDGLRRSPGLAARVGAALGLAAVVALYLTRGARDSLVGLAVVGLSLLAWRWLVPRLTRPSGGDGSSLLGRIDQAVSLYRDRMGTLWVTMIMSFAVHLLIIWSIHVFAGALVDGGVAALEGPGAAQVEDPAHVRAELQALQDVTFSAYCSVIPIIMIISSLPIAPAGWGVGEVAFVHFFATLGVAAQHAASLSFTYRITSLIVSLLGGLFLVMDRKRVLEAAHEETRAEQG